MDENIVNNLDEKSERKDKKIFVDDGIDYTKCEYSASKAFKNVFDIL